MRGCLRALLSFILVGCVCMVIVVLIARTTPAAPKPFNPGGVGQASSVPARSSR